MLPELATALTNLGLRLAATGGDDRGAGGSRRGARDSAQAGGERTRSLPPHLAESLAAASRVQSEAGLAHEALTSARGAVTLFSDLTVAWPAAFVNRLEEALARLRAAHARAGAGAEDQELLEPRRRDCGPRLVP